MFTSLMHTVLDYCAEQYSQSQVSCEEGIACQSCLDKYHYQERDKSYSCERSCFYYVGHYTARFNLELSLALRSFRFRKNRKINILSLGCGPSTELCALDTLNAQGLIPSFNYVGVDYNENWSNIQNFQKNHSNKTNSVSFVCGNALTFLQNNPIQQFDIVIFNYFLSDFEKSFGVGNVYSLLGLIASQLKASSAKLPSLILNDIRKFTIVNAFDKVLGVNYLPKNQERLYYTVKNDTKCDFLQDYGFKKKVDFYLTSDTFQNRIYKICKACKVAGSMQMLFQGNTL